MERSSTFIVVSDRPRSNLVCCGDQPLLRARRVLGDKAESLRRLDEDVTGAVIAISIPINVPEPDVAKTSSKLTEIQALSCSL